MKKKVKLYLHHSHYEPVTYKQRTGFFGIFFNTIFQICYGVGMMVISALLAPVKLIKVLIGVPKSFPDVINRLHTPRFQKAIAAFAVIAISAGTAIHGLNLIAAGQNVKGEVLGASTSALEYLKDAQGSLEAQNTAAAQANLGKALEQFKNSRETLNSTSITLKGLLAVVPQKHDADRLLMAAEKITEAGIKGTQLIELTNNLKLSAVGLSGERGNKETLAEVQGLLNDSVKLATEASTLINEVSTSSLPEKYQPAFVAAKDAAHLFQDNAAALQEVSDLIFNLLLGSKNVLMVFQNNNELRANGGFMGTIGNAKLTDGSIASLDIRSVYDWDGQLKEKILPPTPLIAVNNQWFLRDSNWFASFPQSAARMSAIYEKEGGETPDLIVTMTPEVILDMLERTGPINLPQHGVTLTRENFVEKTQEETSVNYDKKQNQPKQFLADFFPLLMEKLGSQEHGGAMAFLEIFQQSLYQKHVLLYSRNPQIQQKITAFNWGGEIKTTDRDYLSIISSNLGGTKTDRALQRSTKLKSVISPDGTVTNTIEYTVKNPLPNVDGLDNKSFVRFYVPEGSIMTVFDGFSNIPLPRLDRAGYVIDPQVEEWQKDLYQDVNSGTYSGKEAGKSWFGNWLIVRGGESKTVTLTYELPFKLKSIDRHSLLLQKQPGSMNSPFSYDLSYEERSSLWNSNTSHVETNTLTFNQDIIADTFIGIVLKKN